MAAGGARRQPFAFGRWALRPRTERLRTRRRPRAMDAPRRSRWPPLPPHHRPHGSRSRLAVRPSSPRRNRLAWWQSARRISAPRTCSSSSAPAACGAVWRSGRFPRRGRGLVDRWGSTRRADPVRSRGVAGRNPVCVDDRRRVCMTRPVTRTQSPRRLRDAGSEESEDAKADVYSGIVLYSCSSSAGWTGGPR
jgi:hypothetical protein